MPATHALYTRTFWLACATHFTGAMSFGMFLLLPLFIRRLGGDELTIGLVLGVGMAVSVAARPLIGYLLDRVGRRRVLLWSGVLNVVSFPPFVLLETTGPGLYALATLHLVIGGALFAAYFTYIADLVPVTRRVEGIAIFGVAGMAPNGLGPALGEELIARAGYEWFFLVASGFALVSVLVTTRLPERRPAADATGPRPGGAVRDLWHTVLRGGLLRVMVATVVFGAGIDVAFYFVAPFTRDLGIARAAPFFAAYASTTIGLRILGRRLLGRAGTHRIAVPAFAVFAAGLALLALLPAPGVMLLAGIACGAGHGSLFPVMNALAIARTPPRLHGTVVSLYTGALDLGAVLGTPIGGAVAWTAGYRVMFLLAAISCVAASTLMASDPHRHRPAEPR